MPDLSVVVPVHNERDNIVPLLSEIVTALRGKADFEIIYTNPDAAVHFHGDCINGEPAACFDAHCRRPTLEV